MNFFISVLFAVLGIEQLLMVVEVYGDTADDPDPDIPRTVEEMYNLVKRNDAGRTEDELWPMCGAPESAKERARHELNQLLDMNLDEIHAPREDGIKWKCDGKTYPKDAKYYLIEGCFACQYQTQNPVISMQMHKVRFVERHRFFLQHMDAHLNNISAFNQDGGSFYYGGVITDSMMPYPNETKNGMRTADDFCDDMFTKNESSRYIPHNYQHPLFLTVFHNCTIDGQKRRQLIRLPSINWKDKMSRELYIDAGKLQLCEELDGTSCSWTTMVKNRCYQWIEMNGDLDAFKPPSILFYCSEIPMSSNVPNGTLKELEQQNYMGLGKSLQDIKVNT